MALHERLRPWLQAVGKHASPMPPSASGYSLDAEPHTRTLWLKWFHASDGSASMQLACEGLELLALLALVNVEEWRRAVRMTWPEDVEARKWADELPPHTAVNLGIVESRHDIAWYQDVAAHAGEHWDSVAYIVMRAELESRLENGHESSGFADIRVELNGSELLDAHDITLFLTELLRIAMDHRVGTRANAFVDERRPPRNPVYRLAEIDYQLLDCLQDHLLILQQLVAQGVCLSNLWIEESAVTEATARSYIAIGPELFAALRSLEIHDSAHIETIDGIFSLLLGNKSIRSIAVIGNANIVEARLWRWIFAKCFGRSALRSLQKLVLYYPAEPQAGFHEIAEGFMDVSDATTALFTVGATTAIPQTQLVSSVSARAFRRTPPTPGQEDVATAQIVELQEPLEDLRVLEDVGDWTAVAVPGWGHAFVHREDILDRHSFPPAIAQPEEPRRFLKHLVIRDALSSDLVVSMLRVVGRFIKNLGITGSVGVPESLSDVWVRSVLRLCPHLDGFELAVAFDSDTAIASLSVFAQCYEDGVCHARRLFLGAHRITEDPRTFRIFQCLADEHHAMFHQLQELELTLPPARGYETSLLPSVKTMLESNPYLRHLVIRFGSNSVFDRELRRSQVVAAIRAHDREPVAVQLAALDMKSKAAFLSVVLPSCDGSPDQLEASRAALHALDADAIRRIFEYAAVCRQRLVCITIGK